MPLPPDDQPATRLRVGLVGIGSAASRAHLPALSALELTGAVEIVGVCDPSAARRDAVVAAHPGVRAFADNDEMLDSVRPDLLVIATPPSAHLGEIAAAVARGLHVLCEKPLGLGDDDVATLGELAESHRGQTLATVHQYRYAQPWRWMARAAGGAISDGEPFSISVEVERPGTDPLSAGGWRTDPEHEGGILGDHAVHYLALFHELDPACRVVGCRREGPGGREVAWIDVRLAAAGTAHIAVSYAGDRRRNLVRLCRPAQCLEVTWEDGTFTFTRDGRVGDRRATASLSDRSLVNALYSPMYGDLISGIGVPSWRLRATAGTVAVAGLLASALRIAR
ncbi:MAG TPA: Gfo/Idh/MocA family oxidoreductase [Candidatus Dormibacteraeota bacterium]|nr:Gfo/Idh/MocA family oxidoreductase [Candidatus Dormibacteraeota bacterium]